MSDKNNLHYKKKDYYRRKLPHYQNVGGLFFVTYILKSAIETSELESLQLNFDKRLANLSDKQKRYYSEELDIEYRRYFGEYDKALHRSKNNIHWLKNKKCAEIVSESLHFWDTRRIELFSYCIMSNHVHAVFRVYENDETGKKLYLQDIMESVKKFSSKECNKVLGIKGQFWQNETYDRFVRNKGELSRIISYILDNPIKAGLSEYRNQWKWSYVKDDYNEFM